LSAMESNVSSSFTTCVSRLSRSKLKDTARGDACACAALAGGDAGSDPAGDRGEERGESCSDEESDGGVDASELVRRCCVEAAATADEEAVLPKKDSHNEESQKYGAFSGAGRVLDDIGLQRWRCHRDL